MKKIILSILVLSLVAISCKKTSTTDDSEATLEVSKQNMGVIGKQTATWCGPCGGWGFETFHEKMDVLSGKAVFMAFKDAFSEAGNTGDDLFAEVGPEFGLGGSTPTFFANFIKDGDDSLVENHYYNPFVIANSNYKMTLSQDKVNLNTTTKFFVDVEGEFLLAPYMLIDNQTGYQNGHADSPNTVHVRYVAKIAKPVTVNSKKNFGYRLTTEKGAKEGFTVNLEFEATRDILWQKEDISFGLIIFKKQSWGLEFINAFTK